MISQVLMVSINLASQGFTMAERRPDMNCHGQEYRINDRTDMFRLPVGNIAQPAGGS
jgi:hypothetical protein